MMLRLHCEQNI